MASKNNPASSAELIMKYSAARVLAHGPMYFTGYITNPDGTLKLDSKGRPIGIPSKELTAESVKRSLIRSLK